MRVMIICVLCVLPQVAGATVVISEIAWMGDSDSANNEWIELYNSGTESVDTEGWVVSDGAGLTIGLTGSLAAGGYAVLERTDDDSAPGTAWILYAGALSNTGATLTVFDAVNAVVDQVVGGDSWELVGGDNVTKATAQFTDDGWVTATATPGQANVLVQTNTEASGETSDSHSANESNNVVIRSSSGRSTPKPVVQREPLSLELVIPTTAYVNQPVTVTALPAGLGSATRASLEYNWNFGDLTVASGDQVTHTYTYPGQYVVHLTAGYKGVEVTSRRLMTVLPVPVSLSRSGANLLVHNDAAYELDLSGYTVFGTQAFTFPAHTYVVARGTIALPASSVRVQTGIPVQLFDPTLTKVASYFEEPPPLVVTESSVIPPPNIDRPTVNIAQPTTTNATTSRTVPIVLRAPDDARTTTVWSQFTDTVRSWWADN